MVVGMPDDEPSWRQHQDRHMPVDLIVIESGLVVNDEVDQFLFTDGGQDRIFNQLREVPARVDLGPQLPARRPQPHAAILPRRPTRGRLLTLLEQGLLRASVSERPGPVWTRASSRQSPSTHDSPGAVPAARREEDRNWRARTSASSKSEAS